MEELRRERAEVSAERDRDAIKGPRPYSVSSRLLPQAGKGHRASRGDLIDANRPSDFHPASQSSALIPNDGFLADGCRSRERGRPAEVDPKRTRTLPARGVDWIITVL
jgi:hypothetical protein